jgi:hypothetical protein
MRRTTGFELEERVCTVGLGSGIECDRNVLDRVERNEL